MMFFGVLFACQNNPETAGKKMTAEEKNIYLEKGKSITAKSFATLSKSLQDALQEGGIPNAIQYCNLNALSIMDSLSKNENATIRRTSLKVRNLHDTPKASELKILNQYHAANQKGIEIKPIVEQLENNRIAFYAPIRVNEFCLKCHGKLGETLTREDYAVIQEKYPEDKAIGYDAGDLRGIWSIVTVKK